AAASVLVWLGVIALGRAASSVDLHRAFRAVRADYAERSSEPHEDHYVHLRGVTWADYLRLLEVRGDRSVPRLTYLEGTLEIMSPSLTHELIKSYIGRLVEV